MAHSRPTTAAISPLSTESPTSPAITENAKTSSAQISTGPIFSATTASGADTVIRTISLKVSPVTEE